MTAFHPIRQLRDVVSQIGSAINASQEYSRAAADLEDNRTADRHGAREWARHIPL